MPRYRVVTQTAPRGRWTPASEWTTSRRYALNLQLLLASRHCRTKVQKEREQ